MAEVGGSGIHISPWMHQEHNFRCRRSHRTSAESGQESLTSEKNIWIHTTFSSRGKEGKKRRVSRTGAATDPPIGTVFGQREAFEAIGTCNSWSVRDVGEWEPHRQSLPQAYVLYRDTGPLQHVVPGSWSEGIRKQSQGEVLLTMGRWHTEMWGRNCSGEYLWRKAWQPWRTDDTTESCVGVEPSM